MDELGNGGSRKFFVGISQYCPGTTIGKPDHVVLDDKNGIPRFFKYELVLLLLLPQIRLGLDLLLQFFLKRFDFCG